MLRRLDLCCSTVVCIILVFSFLFFLGGLEGLVLSIVQNTDDDDGSDYKWEYGLGLVSIIDSYNNAKKKEKEGKKKEEN